mmetsp:Transcript_1228/g.3436  ORF Transcript_1228/g.3436 Transcript_1228/m.3436 type:complete len:177 (-) Transcript_1228:162-692(-)
MAVSPLAFAPTLNRLPTLYRTASVLAPLARPAPPSSPPSRRAAFRVLAIRGFPNTFSSDDESDPKPPPPAPPVEVVAPRVPNLADIAPSERMIGDLVDFPCVFTFKVVGQNAGSFLEDIVAAVAGAVGIDDKDVGVSSRDRGKWRSLTIKAPCTSADQVYAVYEAIDKDERVKFKF